MKTLKTDNMYKNNTNITINELLKEDKKVISFLQEIKFSVLVKSHAATGEISKKF